MFPCRGWEAPCQRAPRSIKGLPRRCQSRRNGKAWLEARQPAALASALDGGRTWWAHFEFTRINITPTILPKKIEDLREARATMFLEALLVTQSHHRINACRPSRRNGTSNQGNQEQAPSHQTERHGVCG